MQIEDNLLREAVRPTIKELVNWELEHIDESELADFYIDEMIKFYVNFQNSEDLYTALERYYEGTKGLGGRDYIATAMKIVKIVNSSKKANKNWGS